MYDQDEPTGRRAGLQTPMRNRYFYGQLLGVNNFELETDYAIRQRRLLNRLVLGYGVVCGLNVELTSDGGKSSSVRAWRSTATAARLSCPGIRTGHNPTGDH